MRDRRASKNTAINMHEVLVEVAASVSRYKGSCLASAMDDVCTLTLTYEAKVGTRYRSYDTTDFPVYSLLTQ